MLKKNLKQAENGKYALNSAKYQLKFTIKNARARSFRGFRINKLSTLLAFDLQN